MTDPMLTSGKFIWLGASLVPKRQLLQCQDNPSTRSNQGWRNLFQNRKHRLDRGILSHIFNMNFQLLAVGTAERKKSKLLEQFLNFFFIGIFLNFQTFDDKKNVLPWLSLIRYPILFH